MNRVAFIDIMQELWFLIIVLIVGRLGRMSIIDYNIMIITGCLIMRFSWKCEIDFVDLWMNELLWYLWDII